MNLFYLDEDLDTCAAYHIDKHVGKMQLEACQLLTTALWVDKLIGYVPRKLDSDELKVINDAKKIEPDIDSRVFTRYLPTHINHPSNIWVRTSLENFYWTHNYINALNSEAVWRGYKSHASCAEANRLPEPSRMPNIGFTKFALAMPDEFKSDDPIASYRAFYIEDKKEFASWKRRGAPYWWTAH